MNKEDIEHLARLSRIAIDDAEAVALATDITSILGYVSEIEAITSNQTIEKKVGVLHNVFREDKNPTEAGTYTEDLLNAAPERVGQYIQVQKIIGSKS